MTDTNHVVLIGRLTRDLGTDERSFAYTASGTARANVSIAVNRSAKRGEEWVDEVSYFDITIWGEDGGEPKAVSLERQADCRGRLAEANAKRKPTGFGTGRKAAKRESRRSSRNRKRSGTKHRTLTNFRKTFRSRRLTYA